MAPRRYDRRRRDAAMSETRDRIVRAVAELHAELGPSRTGYAAIARRADVAVPTVYKHFPAPARLFEACIRHVSAGVPPLGADLFTGCGDSGARLARLAEALFDRHRRFAPWLRWSRAEAHLFPDMAGHMAQQRAHHIRLIRAALAPDFGAEPPVQLLALIEVLTGFDSWQTLTRDHALPSEAAAVTVAAALAGLLAKDWRRARSPLRRVRAGPVAAARRGA